MFQWVSAEVFRNRGDLDQALKDINGSVQNLGAIPAGGDQSIQMNFVLALIKQGRIRGEENAISLGRSEEALQVFDRAFTIVDCYAHQDPNEQSSRGRLAVAGLGAAEILSRSDAQRSLSFYDHILLHMAEVKNNSSFRRFEVSALAGSSYPLLRLGRAGEAQRRLDAAFALLRQLELYPAEQIRLESEADEALGGLANSQANQGRVLLAIETYRGLFQKVLASGPRPESSLVEAVSMSRIYSTLAALHLRAGQNGPATA